MDNVALNVDIMREMFSAMDINFECVAHSISRPNFTHEIDLGEFQPAVTVPLNLIYQAITMHHIQKKEDELRQNQINL